MIEGLRVQILALSVTLNLQLLRIGLCKYTLRNETSRTCFVGVLCHPCDGDASYLRVTEAQQERAVRFGHQHVLSLLLVHKAQDRPETHTHTNTLLIKKCRYGMLWYYNQPCVNLLRFYLQQNN